jgi:hypothetical protein
VVAEHVGSHSTTGKDRWLFVGEGSEPPHQNTVEYWWRKTLRHASLTGIKLHDLRHFYASGLIAAGCDVVTVQRSLGHAKATTTLNTYAHLWPTAEDRTRKAADSIMSASLGEPAAPQADFRVSTGSDPCPRIAHVLPGASPRLPPLARHSALYGRPTSPRMTQLYVPWAHTAASTCVNDEA